MDGSCGLARSGSCRPQYASMPHEDAGGRLLIPGLIDCHTHLAFGGWRAEEFERRLRGESYLDIARAGGGIASTVRATRAATADALAARARTTLDAMARLGVTTVECKSGYGLDRDNELKLLEVYRALGLRFPAASHRLHLPRRARRARRISGAASGLHRSALPRSHPGSRAARSLASFCDVFVEETAFSLEEARTILRAGQAHGLRAKLHADQLHDGGGAALAAEVGAVSADHLEHVSDDGIARMREAGVVAVSLPIATLYLNAPPMPARALDRGRRARRGGDRFQSGLGAVLSPAAGPDARLHHAAHDPGRSAQRRDHLRRARDWPGPGDRFARTRQISRLRAHRRAAM